MTSSSIPPSSTEPMAAPAFSEKALKQCRRVLSAFYQLYSPLYPGGRRAMMEAFDTLHAVSAWVYEIDVGIEERDPVEAAERQLSQLRAFGISHGLWQDDMDAVFTGAAEYYGVESRWNQKADLGVDEVLQANERRSFDFRLMHRALCSRLDMSLDDHFFQWLQPFEALIELEDDVPSIPKDRRRRTFNVWVMAVGIDGASGFETLLRYRQQVEDDCWQSVGTLPTSLQGAACQFLSTYRSLAPKHILDQMVQRGKRQLKIRS